MALTITLLLGLIGCLAKSLNAEVLVQTFENSAFSGHSPFLRAEDFTDAISDISKWSTVRLLASIVPLSPCWLRFGLRGDAGFVRLWVDHHLMAEGWLDQNSTLEASYALPIPFLPKHASLVQLDLTTHDQIPSFLLLLQNSTAVDSNMLKAVIPYTEELYLRQREGNEHGWNTWLSTDMLSNVLLPQGLAISLAIGNVTNVGGPSCDSRNFPIKHGIKDLHGEYTEIEEIRNGQNIHRLESAKFGVAGIVIKLSSVSLHRRETPVEILFHVPQDYEPRSCVFSGTLAVCPGFDGVSLTVLSPGTVTSVSNESYSLTSLELPSSNDEPLYIIANPAKEAHPPASRQEAEAVIETARRNFVFRLNSLHNETESGLISAIAWNKIYTPYEGIITPIIRGRPWTVADPKAYVLFEWDTYLASIMASYLGDTWTATSNIIRMTQSLWYQGFVPGFWNGKCGELDKSKPPLGAVAVEQLLRHHPEATWVASYLLPYFVEWNSWWERARMPVAQGLVAPGSTRSNLDPNLTINCENHPPVHASACETGLDNSPLYEKATFVSQFNTIDHWDVGMTSFVIRDAQAIAAIAAIAGEVLISSRFSDKAAALGDRLQAELWNEEVGIYLNKKWTTNDWIDRDSQTGSFVVAPTSFYPMFARIPNDSQVVRMIEGYLTNSSEFGVNSEFDFGLPSISRSSSHFHDNSYWRGRIWAPMNYLVFLGLKEYSHLEIARLALKDLERQSRATFLKEWTSNRRVMENYNGATADGCDVHSANPFYHWGALHALISVEYEDLRRLRNNQADSSALKAS